MCCSRGSTTIFFLSFMLCQFALFDVHIIASPRVSHGYTSFCSSLLLFPKMLNVSQVASSAAVSLVYAVKNGTVFLNGTAASNLLCQLSAELVGYFLFYPPLIIAERKLEIAYLISKKEHNMDKLIFINSAVNHFLKENSLIMGLLRIPFDESQLSIIHF